MERPITITSSDDSTARGTSPQPPQPPHTPSLGPSDGSPSSPIEPNSPRQLQVPPGQHLRPPVPPTADRRPSQSSIRARLPSLSSTHTFGRVYNFWKPRDIHKWQSVLLNVAFFLSGLACSLAHCIFYATLDETIVGSPAEQENNLRVGTALAFLSQISLASSVWQTYHQWTWRSIRHVPFRLATLNDIFGAQTSVFPFLNWDMFKNFRLGYSIALFAWLLILPPFFTPGTLIVYDSVQETSTLQLVPYPGIAHSINGHSYAFSPSERGDRFNYRNVLTRVFNGARTALALLMTAVASQGTILPIDRPSNHSAYSVDFYAPGVRCAAANSSTEAIIRDLLEKEMSLQPFGPNITQVDNAYFSFVPTWDAEGNIVARSDVRYQSPAASANELWMVFERYNTSSDRCDHNKIFQVCTLWNATYHLDLTWDGDFQNVTGTREWMEEVPYPPTDEPGTVTEMTQHAYSAFFWVLADQLVGSFGWLREIREGREDRYFGMIQSRVQQSSLLGSPDLFVFFDYNEDKEACQTPYEEKSPQRRRDGDMAQNKTLPELIEELSFNLTVSLMHNNLLNNHTESLVTEWTNVNRYGYNPFALWIPYGLACFFTLLTVVIGVIVFLKHGPMPSNRFQDLLAATDLQIIEFVRDVDIQEMAARTDTRAAGTRGGVEENTVG